MRNNRTWVGAFCTAAGISILSAVCLFPGLLTAWKSFFSAPAADFPPVFTLSSYVRVLLSHPEFHTWFWNSGLMVALIILIHVPVSLLAGYGFSQYTFRGKKLLFFLYIVLMLMPFQATIVPQYLTLSWLGLLDTRAAVQKAPTHVLLFLIGIHPALQFQ